MRKVLLDETLEKNLSEHGWVKVTFLDQLTVSALTEFYLQRQNFQKRAGLHFSLASNNYQFRKEVNDAISSAFSKKSNQLFVDYRMLYGNFMIKEPGLEGNFPLHQDWTYVNEPQFRSVAVWVALTDTDEQKGCLQFVEQSHLWGNTARGPGLSWKFENVTTELRQKLFPVPLKAGEALIWDHRLIHASNPNTAPHARLAATAIYIPCEAEAIHFVKKFEPQEKMCRYKVDTDFFLRYTIQNLDSLNMQAAEETPIFHYPYTISDLPANQNKSAS